MNFCILERGDQLTDETRGELRKAEDGLEANIEFDVGIRSMTNVFTSTRKVIRKSPHAHALAHSGANSLPRKRGLGIRLSRFAVLGKWMELLEMRSR